MSRHSLLALLIALSACASEPAPPKNDDWYPARATVARIERLCAFNVSYAQTDETGQPTGDRSTAQQTESCDITGDFDRLRDGNGEQIAGKATVKLSYRSFDGTDRFTSVELNGGQKLFYTLRKGQPVNILVHKDNPDYVQIVY